MSTKPKSNAAAGSRKTERPRVIFVGSDKGGVGKSFTAALVVDLLEIAGYKPRIVQIDEQERLTNLFPGRVTTVSPAKLDELRRDPSAIVSAFDPLDSAIERTLSDRIPTIVDIGGPQQLLIEEYCGLVDLDADLAEANACTTWLIPTVAEPDSMRGAVRTAHEIARVLPSAKRKLVLNGRDGKFQFYPKSPADLVWREQLEPLCRLIQALKLPQIAAYSWQPCESAGKRLIDVVASDIAHIQSFTGKSRPAAKVLRGDVAAFLAVAQQVFGDVLAPTVEG